jgi:ferritin
LEKLISDNLNESLCQQLGHEKFNANLYLYVAGYLKNKGLNQLSKIFEEQHDEETKHSLMIYSLLTDLSSPIAIPEINEVNAPINSIMDIADIYLQREIDTTNSLNEIKHLAMDEDNPVVEEYMRKMLVLQQSEYAEATDFMDKAQLTGGNWINVFIWDSGLK